MILKKSAKAFGPNNRVLRPCIFLGFLIVSGLCAPISSAVMAEENLAIEASESVVNTAKSCVDLAGHPSEPESVGRGVTNLTDILASDAVPACEKAVEENSSPANHFRLARSLYWGQQNNGKDAYAADGKTAAQRITHHLTIAFQKRYAPAFSFVADRGIEKLPPCKNFASREVLQWHSNDGDPFTICYAVAAADGFIPAQIEYLTRMFWLWSNFAGLPINPVIERISTVRSKGSHESKIELLELLRRQSLDAQGETAKMLRAAYFDAGGDKKLADLKAGKPDDDASDKIYDEFKTLTDRPIETQEQADELLSFLQKHKDFTEAEFPTAQGALYEEGKWFRKDISKARELYEKGWSMGSGLAGYNLARLMLSEGGAAKEEEALQLLLKASRTGTGWFRDPKIALAHRHAFTSIIGQLAFKIAARYAGAEGGSSDYFKAYEFYKIGSRVDHQKSFLAMAYLIRHEKVFLYGANPVAERLLRSASRCTPRFLSHPYYYERRLCSNASWQLSSVRRHGYKFSDSANTGLVVGIAAVIGLAALAAASNADAQTLSYKAPSFNSCSSISALGNINSSYGRAAAVFGCANRFAR